jgi:4-amino-4-deoxy-L-arabinose transferase-like glycosyltransferase
VNAASSFAAAALLAFSIALGVSGARHDTPTVDEFAHLPAGCALLVHGSFGHYAHNPPLAKALMALPAVLSGAVVPVPPPAVNEWTPWTYGGAFEAANRERYFTLFFRARLAMVLLSAAGGLLLFLWARSTLGDGAGLLALALWVLCPNLQAHGRLATLDVPVTVALVAAFFALHVAVRRASPARFVLAGLLFGVACATKFTALVLAPVAVALAALAPRRRLASVACLAFGALLAVNAAYLFRGSFHRADSFRFESGAGRAAARLLPGALPVPLPAALVEGLEAEKRITERGEFGTYFHGVWYRKAPRLYDAAALLLKTPLATLLLALLAASALRPRHLRSTDALFVLAPPLFLLLAFTFGNELKIGVRYLLPVLPFLFLGISSLARRRLAPWARLAGAACLVSLLVTTLLAHPHQLAFFSVAAGGAKGGPDWLLDSNLDWGQDLSELPAWLAKAGVAKPFLLYFGHVDPQLYGIDYALPASPVAGTYVVSVNFAKGYPYVAPDHGRTVRVDGAPAWLRGRTPDATIGASLFVYRLR